MGHWDQFYRDRRVGRTSATGHVSLVGGSPLKRSDVVLFEARFRCPSCECMLVPGVRCEPCGEWAVDATSRLALAADTDSHHARYKRWRHRRAAMVRRRAHAIHGTIVEVIEDSTPSEPQRRVAAYVARDPQSFHSVCGAFVVRPDVAPGGDDPYRSSGGDNVTVRSATLIAPALARGERRELVVGDELILAGAMEGLAFVGDVWAMSP